MSNSAGDQNSTPSVSYYLLEPGNEGNEGEESSKEILSPIPNEESKTYFDEELTQPSHNLRESLLDESAAAGYRLLRRPRSEISGLNYLNALTYTIHVVVWWGVAVFGLDGRVPTHWEETQKYETLVTPATFSGNYLWIPILVCEAIFSIAQLFPHYRARPVVTGMQYRFFYTVLLQIAYTFLYSFGIFYGSFVVAVLALLCLLSLLAAQKNHTADRGSATEYCLFRLPFFLHTGWMLLMTVDHCSLILRRYSDNLSLQLAGDIFSLGILLAVAIVALSYMSDFVIPSVIMWVYVSENARTLFALLTVHSLLCRLGLPAA